MQRPQINEVKKKLLASQSIIFLVLGLIFYANATQFLAQMKEFSQNITLYESRAYLDVKTANQILTKNQSLPQPYPLVLWEEASQENISNPRLKLNVEATVLTVLGRSELLPLDSQTYLATTDLNGCLISEKLAEKVFRDKAVVGKTLTVRGHLLTVRAVITNVTDTLIIARPRDDSSAIFDSSLIKKSNELMSDNTLKNKVSSQLQVTGKLIDFPLMTGLTTFLLLLPLLSLTYYFYHIVQHYLQTSDITSKWRSEHILKIVLVLIWFGYLKTILQLSNDYIPSEWSNFEFYQQLWRDKSLAILQFIKMRKGIIEMRYLGLLIKILCLDVMAFISFRFSYQIVKAKLKLR
ncbi:hypothetical protein RyT2_18200 [Pseudolactococcus yaeyamensis]